MTLPRFISLLFACFLCCSSAEGQFLKKLRSTLDDIGVAPEVQVTLHHPPRLGLEVSRVAFGHAEGDYSGDFLDALIADFTNNGVEVVNRRQIDALLAEHDFSLSGSVDRNEAVQLGKILGPTALVFVSVRRCATEQQVLKNSRRSFVSGDTIWVFTSRTTAHFRASIQVVDLATARINSTRTVQKRVTMENRSSDGVPEFPSEFAVIDKALADAATEVHRWFFPWSETRSLKFFDDTDCDLKLAYNLVASGSFEAAREQSIENVRACEPLRSEKPKMAARSLYNLGMTEFLLGHYDQALEVFDQSLRLHDLNPTPQAITDCRQAKQSALALAAEMEKANAEKVEISTAPNPDEASSATPASDSKDENSVEERLIALRALLEKGLISQDVYEKKQADLLESF